MDAELVSEAMQFIHVVGQEVSPPKAPPSPDRRIDINGHPTLTA